MPRLSALLLFSLTIIGLIPAGRADPNLSSKTVERNIPIVALLVDNPDLEALLISELSDVTILSRADLPLLSTERLLAGERVDLVGATIAIIVDHSDNHGSVRMVDCSSAATVVALDFPTMPTAETAKWIVTRIRPLLDFNIAGDRALVSLAGLHFVTDSPENRSAERTINLILTARLQARGAIVLERWRMRDLVFEKSLRSEESPFWKTSELVDGSISTTEGRLQATVRIRDANGTQKLVQAEGDGPFALADKISALIIASPQPVGNKSGAPSEADAFLIEAHWMLDHGLPREGWQATEAALALGVGQRREAEMLRVRAAAMCAYPDDLKNSGYGQDGGYRVWAFKDFDFTTSVAAATEAVLLSGDYWIAYPPEVPSPRRELGDADSLGIRALYTGLRVLRGAHAFGWASDNTEAVRRLRDSIRRIMALMQDGPLGHQRTTFLIYLTNYAGYWSETPDEAVAFYRKVLSPDFDAGLVTWPEAIRGELAYSDLPHQPFLIGTAPKADFPFGSGSERVIARDEATARDAWAGFLDELARSPHALNRADSLALRWQSTADKNARIALVERMAVFMSENVETLSGPLGYAIFCQFREPFRHAGRSTDFMAGQQSAIDAYVALIRAESPVSPTILSSIWVLFENSNVNITDAQGRAILAALDVRQSRGALSTGYLAGIDDARSSIWERLPALRPVENMEGALVARSLWIAAEHCPKDLRGQVGFSPDAAVWREGFLWVLDPRQGRLWQIDPQSGDASVHSAENRPKPDYESQLVPWGRRFAITAERGVWVLDQAKGHWVRLDLPTARYQIGVAHGDLWAASGEREMAGRVKQTEGNTLYRISPELTCELIVSSRRRPPVHPLDTALAGEPFSVSPSGNDGVLIGSFGERWLFQDSGSGIPLKPLEERFVGNIEVTSNPELIVRHVHQAGDRNRLVGIEQLNASGAERLISHPSRDRRGPARFVYPQELDDLPATKHVAAWHNNALYVLAWSSRGSPWGASEAWLVRINAEGYTLHPLAFDWPEGADKRARRSGHDPQVLHYPSIDAKGLISTDHGLVITGRAMPGFWFIPNEELAR